MAEVVRKIVADTPNRFDRRREQTRRDLLEAAARVISQKGFHAARIADIAEEADVGLGTFYLHFKTKNEIFIELIEVGAQELREDVNTAKAGVADPAERLRTFITTVLTAAAESPELFRIVFGHSPAFLAPMLRVYEPFIADLTAELAPAAGDRAPSIANLTIGMLAQAISWLIDGGIALADLKETTIEFALGGLAASGLANKK